MKITAIFMLAMFQLVSWAQVESGLHLGNLELLSSPHVELAKRTITERLLNTDKEIPADFISKVGGVAFVQVARPEMLIHSFQLGCNKDNNTAYVEINGVTYPIPLPVWQLQPIVEYADSNSNAAVSLFGIQSGGYPIVFHHAFIDNLLGVRLLQSDLLMFVQDAIGSLPLDKAGNSVLEASEVEMSYNYSKNYKKRCKLWKRLRKQFNMEKDMTYILTDFAQPISFRVDDGKINIQGNPYYSFYSVSMNENSFLSWLFLGDRNVYQFEQDMTESLRHRWDDVYELNPVVMDAVLNTCQWTAFFRYAKEINNENWNSFCQQVKSMNGDKHIKDIETPLAFYSPGMLGLDKLDEFESNFMYLWLVALCEGIEDPGVSDLYKYIIEREFELVKHRKH